eukprot:gene26920-55745_t
MDGPQNAAELELLSNICAAEARANFDIWFHGERKAGNHKIVDQLLDAQKGRAAETGRKAARAAARKEEDEAEPLQVMVKGCNYVTTGPVCKHLVEKEPDCVKAVLGEDIEADDASDVAELIKKHPGLTCLDLSTNKIGSEGAKTIAAAMSENSTITDLDLSGCQIGQGAGKAIAATKLERLLLNGNQMKIYGTEDIMKGLRQNTCLTSLGLFFNAGGDKSSPELCAPLLGVRGQPPIASRCPPPSE